MNSKDTFHFPVKLTDNEASLYRTWGLMQYRYRISVIILFSMIFVIVTAIKYLDRFDVLRLGPITDLLDLMMIRSGTLSIYSVVLDVVLLCLLGIVAFSLIRYQRSINASVVTQRVITCRIDKAECVVHCRLSRGTELIETQDIGIYQATSVCDTFSHTFLLNGISYLLGDNDKREIYPDMKPSILLESPKAFTREESDLRIYCDQVRSVIDSIESAS